MQILHYEKYSFVPFISTNTNIVVLCYIKDFDDSCKSAVIADFQLSSQSSMKYSITMLMLVEMKDTNEYLSYNGLYIFDALQHPGCK